MVKIRHKLDKILKGIEEIKQMLKPKETMKLDKGEMIGYSIVTLVGIGFWNDIIHNFALSVFLSFCVVGLMHLFFHYNSFGEFMMEQSSYNPSKEQEDG